MSTRDWQSSDTKWWRAKHVTREPGDFIFAGTPVSTEPLRLGDVVEIEGVGVLKNPVVNKN